MMPNARPARRVGCVLESPVTPSTRHHTHAGRRGEEGQGSREQEGQESTPRCPFDSVRRRYDSRGSICRARRDSRDSFHRRAATRDPAQAVSKRAPKKKKTYDSDEESDNYDDDSEVRPGVQSSERERRPTVSRAGRLGREAKEEGSGS